MRSARLPKPLGFAVAILLCGIAIAQDFSDELPRIPPTEPADTLANFTVADGFRMELVASEPLIGSPVAIAWDERGRMYVCEMRGYSENRDDRLSTIGLLEDTDGDGVYDRRTEFAAGLAWPTGIFPHRDGLLVGDAPDLLFLKDIDGDGKSDQREVVLTGFGTSNVQGLMNSFRWGLDNRIHIACSSVGGSIRKPAASDAAGVNIRGRDVSIDPRTYDFELTSGAAQHGMCFDDWGRKFVSSNSDHIQQVMYEERYVARNPYFSPPPARISIAADGPQAEVFRSSPVEPWRIVRTRLRVAGAVPGPIEGGGRAAGYFTGATGITIYRGDAWPETWKGLAIVGDVGSNLIHRKRLEPHGLEFIARRIDQQSELVTSRDIWFRPAQFASAPDGSLYVIDVCREVIEHPKSLPPQIKQHLDLTAGRDRGRIYRLAPDQFQFRAPPDMASYATSQLVALLAHPNAWHRITASRLLFERQDRTAVPELESLAERSEAPLARMHALYALSGLQALEPQVLSAALKDNHPQVRRHAVRLCEALPDSKPLVNQLASMTGDEAIEVRYQLAFTAGSVELDDRAEVLAEIIRGDVGNRWMAAAVQSSAYESAGPLFAALVADPHFRSAAAADFLAALASQISIQDERQDIETAVAALREIPHEDAGFALPIIGELLRGVRRRGSVLAEMSASGKLLALDQAVDRLIQTASRTATDRSQPPARRAEATQALAIGNYETVGPLLLELLDSRQPYQIQRAAINSLRQFSNDELANSLIDRWGSLSPQLRDAASDAMFSRPAWTGTLFEAVDRGRIPISSLTTARLQVATQSKNEQIRDRARKLLEKSSLGRRDDVVARYRKALTMDGSAKRGRAIFKEQCSGCHRVEGVGHEIGPNLAAIKTRGPETILVNVLDPNREVNPEYLGYVALTVDGRSLSGMIAGENATSLTLRRGENETDTVLRVDLEQLRSTGLSIMPEGLEKTIDPQAMADLIAYLMQAS